MIKNRLSKNFKKLSPHMERESIGAWRLYDRDIPEYPYIVDCFQDAKTGRQFAMVWSKTDSDIDADEKKQGHESELISAIVDVLGITTSELIFKSRERQDSKSQYERRSEIALNTIISEGKLKFKINLTEYLDTGLFLDHRPLRKWIQKEINSGERFLNLFAYTCSMSVSVASAGGHCTSVDLSQKYLDWGQENFALNKLPAQEHLFIRQGAREYLEQARVQKITFDLIFLDPPTFSNSKRTLEDFDVERDHEELIRACLQILSIGGHLYFSTNKRKFKLASALSEFSPNEITEKSIPMDFHDKKIHQLYKFVRF
jgi:23S rRNA (cytosine1962-C5)-methyltransferase